jgi:hypothetical protein
MIIENAAKHNTFAVLTFRDIFGSGYLVHQASHVAAAIADGWEVIADGLTRADADNVCRVYKTAGQPESNIAPVLSDLLVYDFTQDIETRAGQTVQEFDLIRLPVNGIMMEATVTWFDEDTVELDGFIEVSRHYAETHAELIAKAESDCGFISEYNSYLQDQAEKWERIYAVALHTSSTMAA